MPTPINRTQLRKETHRSGFVGNVPIDEAVSVVLRRNGNSDYRLAIDDAALIAESNETQALLETEFDQTQALLQTELDETQALLETEFNQTQALLQTEFDQTQTAINNTTSAVNTLRTQIQNTGGLVPEKFTSVVQTLPSPSDSVEEYIYTLAGGGTATVTITYEDASKETLVSVVRS